MNWSFYLQAFTHSSYTNEFGPRYPHNERMEFLGDSVLGLVINHYLYQEFPGQPEGKLSKIKAKMASEGALAKIADSLNLGQYLLLGKGEKEAGGQNRPSNLANLFEAFLAAVFLDQGLKKAETVVLPYLQSMIPRLHEIDAISDYKSLLQEYSQKHFKTVPKYITLDETGPDHEKEFTIRVYLDEVIDAVGKGMNKRKAEQAAAKKALESISKK